MLQCGKPESAKETAPAYPPGKESRFGRVADNVFSGDVGRASGPGASRKQKAAPFGAALVLYAKVEAA